MCYVSTTCCQHPTQTGSSQISLKLEWESRSGFSLWLMLGFSPSEHYKSLSTMANCSIWLTIHKTSHTWWVKRDKIPQNLISFVPCLWRRQINRHGGALQRRDLNPLLNPEYAHWIENILHIWTVKGKIFNLKNPPLNDRFYIGLDMLSFCSHWPHLDIKYNGREHQMPKIVTAKQNSYLRKDTR